MGLWTLRPPRRLTCPIRKPPPVNYTGSATASTLNLSTPARLRGRKASAREGAAQLRGRRQKTAAIDAVFGVVPTPLFRASLVRFGSGTPFSITTQPHHQK
jgi:hypothetical protein